jgi:Tol biopolymer transport system component/DNA-binding winged helix-turn-helix (wHTH) protein
MKEAKNRFYEFGEFRIDARERLLSKNGKPVAINFKSFDVLLVLIQNNGQLLEKEELMRKVWAEAIVEEANLKNCISALRKALGDTPNQSRYIQTLPKLGYKFVAPVILLPDDQADFRLERQSPAERLIEDESAWAGTSSGQAILPSANGGTDGAGGEQSSPAKGKAAGSSAAEVLPEPKASQTPYGGRPLYKRPMVILTAALLLSVGAFFLLKGYFAVEARPTLAFDRMKLTRLTDIGNGFTVISPDGKSLAYSSGDKSGAGLSVKNLESSLVTELLPKAPRSFSGITFSDDSRKLYCTIIDKENPEGVLYEMALTGEAPKKCFAGVNTKVSASPDGRRVVFRRTDNAMGRNMLVVANLDGSDEQVLLPASMRHFFYDCLWSPGGSTITLILRTFDEDGNRFWQIAEVAAGSGAIKSITEPQFEPIISISWMPDESGLVAVMREANKDFAQLWFVSYRDGSRKKITNDVNNYIYVLVTEAGKAIYAAHNSFTSTVWVGERADPGRAEKLNLASGYYTNVQWAPDNRILYTYAGDIWVMSADGNNRQRLTADAGVNFNPVMSPDGRYLAYLSNRSGHTQLWRSAGDGSNARQLTNVPNDVGSVRFSADGKWLFYSTWFAVGYTMWKVSVDGGNALQLTFKDTLSAAVSPDGKELAYTFYDELKKRYLLAFKSTEGGEPHKVYEFPALESYFILQWEKEGLFCTNKAETELFLLPLSGGKPKQLTNFNTGEAIHIALSADSKRLAYARINMNKDSLLISDFR